MAQDVNFGFGSVVVTMPGGGQATGTKVGLHTFCQLLNVQLDFGAQGVGQDDAAIQAAMAACVANPQYRGLYFPPGNWTLNAASLVCSVPLILMGAGRGVTTLTINSPTIHGITVTASDVTIRDLSVVSTVAGRTGFGVYVSGNNGNITLENVAVSGHSNGFALATVAGAWLDRCLAVGNGVGLYLTSCDGLSITALNASGNSVAGVQLTGLTTNSSLVGFVSVTAGLVAQPYALFWVAGATGPLSIIGGSFNGTVAPMVGTPPALTRIVGALGLTDQ